jgi:hypothetical protein
VCKTGPGILHFSRKRIGFRSASTESGIIASKDKTNFERMTGAQLSTCCRGFLTDYQTLDGWMPWIRGKDPAYATYPAAC